jgi:hypothetical protein
VPHPLNVVFIVDTTGSMNGNDPACGATRIVCAAVTAAQNAAKAGTWGYSIAYGASSLSCSTDSAPCNSSCFTMSQIANVPGAAAGTFVNDPTKFYSDNANGCRSAQTQISHR